jgi:hypothetical protein
MPQTVPQAVPAQAVPPPYPYTQPGATPQAWSPASTASGNPKFIGLIIALAGGIATLVAFFALPLLNTGQLGQVGQSSVPQLGDLSNPSAFKVIGLLNQLAPLCQQSGDPNCSGFQLLGIGLWVPAIAAILAVLIAGLLWLTSASSHKRPAVLGSVGILVFSILGTLPLAFALVGLNAAASQIAQYGFGGSVSQLLGAGFWLMIVGLVVAVVGSITQMVVR